MDISTAGKWIFFVGIGVVIFGALLWTLGKTGLPFGSLPGDVRIERGRFSFYFPVATCLIVSAILTLLLSLVALLLRK
jgi:hypothetical protein